VSSARISENLNGVRALAAIALSTTRYEVIKGFITARDNWHKMIYVEIAERVHFLTAVPTLPACLIPNDGAESGPRDKPGWGIVLVAFSHFGKLLL
jgi:hypothetical protein